MDPVILPRNWKTRTVIMANAWGVVFTFLLITKALDPTSYVGLMLQVFGMFAWKTMKEHELNAKLQLNREQL